MKLVSQIGCESRTGMARLERLVQAARLPGVPEVEALFEKALSHLHKAQVRISVVGQVKAGKSSLINTLSGMPGLLPTEVNPWTAVITNLHFGHPDKPQSGGKFQLFSEDEWQQMLEGDKEARALAEDLLPGFDTEILKQQVADMQKQARHRLGELYRHLLGKTHKFSAISSEILERYVSAGHQQGPDDGQIENAGRFSGITKSADVFLPAGPFALPVTLSDTPGINDPFLVRDEITTSSFREADIFIVAISVHQALGAADMALLKMLSRHKGKGLVIFVNRIDEMEDLCTDVPNILQALETRLSNELEGVDYAMVAGSAHWGDIALNGGDALVHKTVSSEAFRAYCRTCGIPANAPGRQKLAAASGDGRLRQALSTLIAEGPVQSTLSAVAGEVAVAIGLAKSILQERMRNDEVTLLDVGDVPAILEAEKTRLTQQMDVLREMADELGAAENDIRTRLLENGDVVSRSITNTLEAALDRFADSEAARLKAGFVAGGLGSWSLDTADLRERIDTQTVESYQNGRAETDALIMRFAKDTVEKFASFLPDFKVGQLLENLPHEEVFPGFKAQTTLIDIKLVNERGWKFWKRAEMPEDQAISAVKKVIRREMLPGLSACCEAASLGIAERTGEALERIFRTTTAARYMIDESRTRLQTEIETLSEGVSETAISRINQQRQARLARRRDELVGLEKAEQAVVDEFMKELPLNKPRGKTGQIAGA